MGMTTEVQGKQQNWWDCDHLSQWKSVYDRSVVDLDNHQQFPLDYHPACHLGHTVNARRYVSLWPLSNQPTTPAF